MTIVYEGHCSLPTDTRNNAGKHYGYYYYTHYRVSCSSSSGSLLDCSRTSYGYAYTSSFGVKCESPSTGIKDISLDLHMNS